MRPLVRYIRRHHVGLLALFLAMSGSAYALSLPKGSVGTRQLKRNAVTSAKVANHSLKAVDLAHGVLRVGPRGPTGPAGSAGPPGARGPQGPRGARGPSDAFSSFFGDFDVPPSAGPPFELGEQDLPAGDFIVMANASVRDLDDGDTRGVSCALGDPGFDSGGDDSNAVDEVSLTLAGGTAQALQLIGMIELDRPETLSFDCFQSGSTTGNGLHFEDIDVGALQVGALH